MCLLPATKKANYQNGFYMLIFFQPDYASQFLMRNEESRNFMTRNSSQGKQGIDQYKKMIFFENFVHLFLFIFWIN